jgi:hypothetical protein
VLIAVGIIARLLLFRRMGYSVFIAGRIKRQNIDWFILRVNKEL